MKNFQAILVAGVLSVFSCGSTTTTSDGGTGGGSGGGTATGGGSGGGTATGGGSGTTTLKSGSVELSQLAIDLFGNIQWTGSVSASFTTVTVATGNMSGCTTHTEGPCTSRHCMAGGVGNLDAGVSLSNDSAGVVTVSGTRADGGIVLTPKTDGSYDAAPFRSQLWGSGDQVTISAAGAKVPGFGPKTLSAPSPIVVTAPACPNSLCSPIPRSAPLTVSWTTTASAPVGTISVLLAAGQATGVSGAVECTFASAAGTATIPTSLLGDLVAGQGLLTVINGSQVDFTSGDYATTVRATTSGLTGLVAIQ